MSLGRGAAGGRLRLLVATGLLVTSCFDARDHAHESAAQRRGEAYVRVALGDSFLREGQAAEAVAAFESAVALAPEELPIALGLAKAYTNAGRPDDATRTYERALAAHPDAPEIHAQWGAALLEEGRADESVAHLQRAAELDPGNRETFQLLGVARVMARSWAEAAAAFDRAAELGASAEPRVLVAWAAALARSGHPARARERLEEVLSASDASDPLHVAARRALAVLGAPPGEKPAAERSPPEP